MANKKMKLAKDIVLKINKEFMLVDSENIKAAQIGDIILITSKTGRKRKSDFILSGSKNTVVSFVTIEKGELHVTADLSIKDIEKCLKDAKKRMKSFKKKGKITRVATHLGPDLSLWLEE